MVIRAGCDPAPLPLHPTDFSYFPLLGKEKRGYTRTEAFFARVLVAGWKADGDDQMNISVSLNSAWSIIIQASREDVGRDEWRKSPFTETHKNAALKELWT